VEENSLKDRSSTRSAGSEMELGNPIYIYTHTYTHTHIHTHLHTHTQRERERERERERDTHTHTHTHMNMYTHTLTGETVVCELEHHEVGAGGRFSQDLEILISQCPREFVI